jgi:uncharacterized membrane protein YfcA
MLGATTLGARVSALSAGVLSGFTGFGLAAVVVPLLLVVYEPKTVVAPVAVLTLVRGRGGGARLLAGALGVVTAVGSPL